MAIGKMLKKESLAKLARTSRRVCSMYEQQLYIGKANTNIIKSLLWGARHGSVPVMRNAHGWGADLNTRTSVAPRRSWMYNYASLAKATVFQVTIRDGQTEAMQWLWNQGVLVDTHGKPARNMCKCGESYDGSIEVDSSSLHIAVCNGNLEAVRLLLRLPHEAVEAFKFSQQFDSAPILNTAVTTAFRQQNISMLNAVLENSTIKETINAVKSEGACTPLCIALLRSNRYPHHSLTQDILSALVRAGATLGPYPPGAFMAGRSPLMTELENGSLRTTARFLLQLGCDPNGNRPDPITSEWRSPLHFYIGPEHENRHSLPLWYPYPRPWQWQLWQGGNVSEVREFIALLLQQGASLDIVNFEGVSPLDNALSYMADFLAPRRRVAGYKLVKLLLANVQDNGISEESRMRAQDVMATVVRDLRAENATHDLSDMRLRGPSMGANWDEEATDEDEDVPAVPPMVLGGGMLGEVME